MSATRCCAKCQAWKPLADFPVRRDKRRPGLDGQPERQCKTCRNQKRRGNPSKRPEYRQEQRRRARAKRGCDYQTLAEIRAEARQRALSKAMRPKRRTPTIEERRERNREYQRERRRSPEGLARRAVQHAVEQGLIHKPDNCERCDKLTPRHVLHGHHEDYANPLDVKWLCAQCHAHVDPRYSRGAA